MSQHCALGSALAMQAGAGRSLHVIARKDQREGTVVAVHAKGVWRSECMAPYYLATSHQFNFLAALPQGKAPPPPLPL